MRGEIVLNCPVCGDEFTERHRPGRAALYCSDDCCVEAGVPFWEDPGKPVMNQRDVGAIMGLCHEAVGAIERRALFKLRRRGVNMMDFL